MIAYVGRRVVYGAVVLFMAAFFVYGVERALRPENYPGQAYLPHVWHDMQRALFHLDFGQSCGLPGCPHIHDLWMRGLAGDLWMLGGGLLIGMVGGVGAGLLCVRWPRSRLSRSLEWTGMLAYCVPVYVVGLGLLLLFNDVFGAWPIPYFFDALPAGFTSPLASPWDWGRSYLVPWLVLAAPLGGACLRGMVSMTIEELDRDYVRTAEAKGLRRGRVIRRHAAPGGYVSILSMLWGLIPTIVFNVMLVEIVFSVPGFFKNAWRAAGQDPAFPSMDIPMLQALALWAAVLIVVMSILVDVALAAIDPRVRIADQRSQ